MIHDLLNISIAKSYLPYQILENKQMLYEMLEQPERLLENIRRFSNSLTLNLVFGWRTIIHDDPKLIHLFDGFGEFTALNETSAAALADFFPTLRWLPNFVLPAKAKATKLHKAEKELYLGHWLNAKDSVKNGTAPPCFCIGMARQQKDLGFSDDQAAYISGSLLEAGSDTTSSTLYDSSKPRYSSQTYKERRKKRLAA